MSNNPWSSASENLTQFISLDRGVAQGINQLTQHQARDTQLDFAIESGRSFGVRQMQYNVMQQRHLNTELSHESLTAKTW